MKGTDEEVLVFALNLIHDISTMAGISSYSRVTVIRTVLQHLDARNK